MKRQADLPIGAAVRIETFMNTGFVENEIKMIKVKYGEPVALLVFYYIRTFT